MRLTAEAVTVSFDGTRVLDGVDLDAPAGAITGVTGASGSGKTTLLRVLAGLQRPDAGKVRRPDGSVALLAQHPRLVCNPRWTMRRIIAEPATIRGEQPEKVWEKVGLDAGLLDRHPGQVSDGQLQRACLGRVLTQRAGTVLCDEPTAMLDPIAAATVIALLREISAAGAVVVVVSHDPELIAALAERRLSLS